MSGDIVKENNLIFNVLAVNPLNIKLLWVYHLGPKVSYDLMQELLSKKSTKEASMLF